MSYFRNCNTKTILPKTTFMKKSILICGIAIFSLFAFKKNEPTKITVVKLAESTKSWNGTDLPPYLDGKPQVTVLKITIPPHTKLSVHKHLEINAGVLTKGELTVIDEKGDTLNLKAGDEVVLTKQDYPNMINAWKQREKRDGIKLVWVNLELPSEDENYLIHKYTDAFTPKTKLVQITHMINWIGQKMPVRKIADEAKKKNIDVLVDGAHTFAIDFQEMLGAKRKEERLLYLKNYWMNKVKDLPKVRLHTSFKKEFGCAIGLVSIAGKEASELDSYLFNNYKIHTVPIKIENIHGLRITPNVYTSIKNLDVLVAGITTFTKI